ncbi:hypothetical protein B4N89_46335 [Embleya scabrispora]|uniref:Helicase-associated domain-containing protein n=1 Tax=Embleya scabrispora TaxID=159449 RepID=A0A1T3NI54_9ACTN|nr:hypothetical protein B4N89_46335 [Embleya scabrispora]
MGRALRQKPGQGKVAGIVVPVFLDDHEHPDDMLLSDGHRYLVTVLEALRAHAPELVEALAVPQASAHGAARAAVDHAPDDADNTADSGAAAGGAAAGGAAAGGAAAGGVGAGGVGAGGVGAGGVGAGGVGAGGVGVAEGVEGALAGPGGPSGADGPGEGVAAETRPFLRFSSPRDPAVVADFVRLRVIDPDERDWIRGYLAARRFLRAHGHMRIPLDARDEHDHDYPIGQWAAVQRREYTAGRLHKDRVRKLVMLGMVWSHPDAAFDDGLATARRYLERVGHLAAPQGAVQDGVRVGQWLANQRRHGVMDGHPERVAALDALDPWWRPDGWTIAWQRAANEVRLFLERGGALDELVPGYVAGGEDIGRWTRRHAKPAVWGKLRPGQIEQLRELGITPETEPGAAVFEGGAAGGDGVEDGVAVTAGVGGAEGRGERTGGGNGAREGGAGAAGGAVGAAPAPRRGRGAWETAFTAAVAYRQREGHLEVPRAHVETVTTETATGPGGGAGEGGGAVEVRLGKWVNNQRTRRSSLSVERERLLTELGMRW